MNELWNRSCKITASLYKITHTERFILIMTTYLVFFTFPSIFIQVHDRVVYGIENKVIVWFMNFDLHCRWMIKMNLKVDRWRWWQKIDWECKLGKSSFFSFLFRCFSVWDGALKNWWQKIDWECKLGKSLFFFFFFQCMRRGIEKLVISIRLRLSIDLLSLPGILTPFCTTSSWTTQYVSHLGHMLYLCLVQYTKTLNMSHFDNIRTTYTWW